MDMYVLYCNCLHYYYFYKFYHTKQKSIESNLLVLIKCHTGYLINTVVY